MITFILLLGDSKPLITTQGIYPSLCYETHSSWKTQLIKITQKTQLVVEKWKDPLMVYNYADP